jgi:hypothetical protein
METLTKIIIPIATFILGVLITLLLKRYELKRASFRQHVEKSSKLAMDWYNQLHNLTLKLKEGTKKDDLTVALFSYQQSREFLPQLQLCITALRKHTSGRPLVEELEQFRKMVTDYPDEYIDGLLSILSKYSFDHDYHRWECKQPFFFSPTEHITWNISMEELDAQVQKIQVVAGKLLS